MSSITESKSKDYKSAYHRALGLLARREHSEIELINKLKQKGFSIDIAKQVAEDLKEKTWLSDQRFCESYINSYTAKGQGPIKIKFNLKEKGISSAVIEQTFTSLKIDWHEVINKVYQKKFGAESIESTAEKVKRYRYLQGKGFTNEQINLVLG